MPTFVVGDVHGHVDQLVSLLREADLLDEELAWAGADARLWFVGDLVDRGPDGIGVIDFVRQLQRQGDVRCLLGNHEAMLLGALRFGEYECAPGATFQTIWELNGGMASDLARLRPEHVAWIEKLPPVAREGEWLLVHADTDRYLEYGDSVNSVWRAIDGVLAGGDSRSYARLLDVLSGRSAFEQPERLQRLLAVLGGEKVVHGHTPISFSLGVEPELVTSPLSYAGGRALNVDHCLFAGGPGFVAELPEAAVR